MPSSSLTSKRKLDLISIEKKLFDDKSKRRSTRQLVSIANSNPDPETEEFNKLLASARLLPSTYANWSTADAMQHLVSQDKRFVPVIVKHGIPNLFTSAEPRKKTEFQSLFQTIVFQQLATKAADAIFEKVIIAIKGSLNKDITPPDILAANFEIVLVDGKKKVLINGQLSGLSESKSLYIRSLAEHFNDETKLKEVDFNTLTDEEIYDKLIVVKGLGPWSIHMFMMFVLQRPNVLPVGDLGIRKGITHFLGISKPKIDPKELAELCLSWSPYSTFASLLMWKISDDLTKTKSTK